MNGYGSLAGMGNAMYAPQQPLAGVDPSQNSPKLHQRLPMAAAQMGVQSGNPMGALGATLAGFAQHANAANAPTEAYNQWAQNTPGPTIHTDLGAPQSMSGGIQASPVQFNASLMNPTMPVQSPWQQLIGALSK